jgi:hypothetical protein
MRIINQMFVSCAATLLLCGATPASAQTGAAPVQAKPAAAVTSPRWARISFFAQGATTSSSDGTSSTFSELITNVSARSATGSASGLEYGLDARFGAYPSTPERDGRISIYDAYVGARLLGGRVLARAGHMWLTDLGALGAVAGGMAEAHAGTVGGLRLRAGLFGGLEPEILDASYVPDVKKFGAYVALDGNGARKHVIGFTTVRNGSLTERSVVSVTNYVPVRRWLYVYQAAEVDLRGPGGRGNGGLTYFFTNARISPITRADLQLTYHRGRSIDARTITDDIRNGRPVTAKMLDGFLFESAYARLTIEVLPHVRVFGGYGRDKSGSADASTDRVTIGAYTSNLFGSGVDVNVSDYRYSRGGGSSYDAWYASLGRSFGSRVYLSSEYSSSLSVIRYERSTGVIIETRPKTQRYGASATINLNRALSLTLTGDRTNGDGYHDVRGLAGITCRF